MSTSTAPDPPSTRGTSARRPTAASLRRIEPAAIGAVVFREATMFRRFWRSTTFSSVVEPTIYLLAFGFGFGSLVAQVAGYDYIDFVGTGIVATAVLFGSAFPGMFGTFIKRVFQKTYDAVLAAPVDTVATIPCRAIRADELVQAALRLCAEKKINELPVVDHDGRLVGLLDVQDLADRGFAL